MSASHIESIPMTWDDEREGPFFACVRDLFTPSFLQGAGVLLASHDSEASEPVQVVVATPARGGFQPHTSGLHTASDRAPR